jgi:polyisoprenoid-binding protein YceI
VAIRQAVRQAGPVSSWRLDERHGDLVVRTRAEGSASRLGHRLTIGMARWRAVVTETAGVPSAVRVEVDVRSLRVRGGEGGLKRLSVLERAMVRHSALKALAARQHPTVEYAADTVTRVKGGYDLEGELTIHGVTRARRLHVAAEDGADGSTGYRATATVRQTDFGVQPVSFFAGALLVADDVTVELSATRR